MKAIWFLGIIVCASVLLIDVTTKINELVAGLPQTPFSNDAIFEMLGGLFLIEIGKRPWALRR